MRERSVIDVERAYDRAAVCLEGLSLGDAFGESFFGSDAPERIAARTLRASPWRWTDDTAMALGVIETLVAQGKIDQGTLAQNFARRYRDDPARGYGGAMHEHLTAVSAGVHWRLSSESLFDGSGSFGNGAAMRAPIIGAWFADELDRVVVEARRSAEVTHAHVEGIVGAIAVAVAAGFACRGESTLVGRRFLESVVAQLPASEVRMRTERLLALDGATPVGRIAQLVGNGSDVSAQDTVPLVLWCAAQNLDDYQAALWHTVSALGDRDTTCAMVGGIVACRAGRERLPPEWLSRREPVSVAPGPIQIRKRRWFR
jgi:ADP-ribosylglycohydrolase